MQYLDETLMQYAKTDMYPFHMPGHKRANLAFPNPYSIDITEIDGFDNLHHSTGILKEAQQRAAKLYGSKRCYYLVNGSTCGLLAAICAATGKKDKILVARNSHKAVYHALFLNELHAEYLYPMITENGIQGQITAKQVEQALNENTDIKAVMITSPTYEGIVSDIAGIAEAAHKKGIPLIVDAAHGAHFGFDDTFPENPVRLGADAVIMSLHKTLPSFTQTALLHICSDRIPKEKIERYLGIFQTSSPSYLFMAGMDACTRMLEQKGTELFKAYGDMLAEFYESVKDLKYLHVMNKSDLSETEAYDWDVSKIVIFSEKAGMTGQQLHEKLLYEYHLQMEMVSGYYVLGMTSMMDKREGFLRLSKALHEIDDEIAREAEMVSSNDFNLRDLRNKVSSIEKKSKKDNAIENVFTKEPLEEFISGNKFIEEVYQSNLSKLQISEALEQPAKEVPFSEAVNQISAEYIYLYPPGIPVIVPGEVITADFLQRIETCMEMGLAVEGYEGLSGKRIKIVYF